MKKFSLFSTAIVLFALTVFSQTPNVRRVPGPNPQQTPENSSPSKSPASSEKTPEDFGAPSLEELVFDGTNNPSLKFEKAPADLLLKTYADTTRKTLLVDPNIPKVNEITLKSHPDVVLSQDEFLQAIESVLAMHNISLLPVGEKFIRVLPSKELRKLGIQTSFTEPKGGAYAENNRYISQIFQLKHITTDEASKALEGFKSPGSAVQLFERTNSILFTDTAENINRMMEIIKYIDIPIEIREETHVRPIKYAKASEVKSRLDEILNAIKTQQQQQQQKKTAVVESRNSGAPGMQRRELSPPGITRPGDRRPIPPQPTPTPALTADAILNTLIADAERGIIRGEVQIVADERTNILLFISRPENMKFFDKIIDVLDVEVQSKPDVIVNVFRLEYATAKEVADMLNNLIGNTSDKKNSDKDNPNLNNRNNFSQPGYSTSLSEAANRQRRFQNLPPATDTKNKIGELNKENVTILADERSNAILVMASPSDMISVESIIKQLDIQLSQVVIETVIVAIDFANNQETGMDWVQRAMLNWTGSKNGPPTFAVATSGGSSGGTKMTESMTGTDSFPASTSGVNAWFTFFDLNLDIILKAVQTDSRARVVSSPRITTMDNKEATLESTKRIYWSSGTTYYENSGNTSDNVKSEDVGIKLTVTPRIYKKGFVTLEVKQTIDDNDGYEPINGKNYPKLTSRIMDADVSVQSGETVVLGGLAQNKVTTSRTKVPVLGSIPLLGWLFRYEKEEHSRTEIIVFLTPRVIDSSADIEDDARRIKASINTEGVWDSGWSHSRLADPLPPEQAQKILENAQETIAPPKNPLSGYLFDLNDSSISNEAINEAKVNAVLKESPTYIHFSDLPSPQTDEPSSPSEIVRIAPSERIKNVRFSEIVSVDTNTPPLSD